MARVGNLDGYACVLDAAEALFLQKEAAEKEAMKKVMQDEINSLKCEVEEGKRYIESLREMYSQAHKENETLKIECEALKKANDVLVNAVNVLETKSEDEEKDVLILESRIEMYERILKLLYKA